MKIKTFVLSFLYSATTFILVVYISVSYNYNRINRFGLRENVKKINVTSLAPTDLNNRVDIINAIQTLFQQTKTSIIYVPNDSNGIEVMVINRGIEDVFKGVTSSSADFLLTSNNTFFSRNIEQYGFDRSQFTGEFMKNESLNFDYIANYEGFGTTVEGLYYLETDCKECSEEWEHVFPQEIYDVSSMPVNRSFINVVINNPAINIMLISYLIISMIVYMFIKHHLILDRRRIAVNRLYGGHRGSITLMYLKSLLKIEFGSVVVAGLVLMPIMNPLFITEKVPGIGLISTLISLTILFITTSVSVYLNTKSGGGTAWK